MPIQIIETELLKYRRRFKGVGFSYHDAAGRKTSQRYRGLLEKAPALGRVSPPVAKEASNTRPQRRPFSCPNRDLLSWKPGASQDASRCNTRNCDLPNKQHKLKGTGVVIDQELRTQKLQKRFGYALQGSGLHTSQRIIPKNDPNSEGIRFIKRVQIERPPSHPEVINYRFSGGICPPHKFIDTRQFCAAQAKPC